MAVMRSVGSVIAVVLASVTIPVSAAQTGLAAFSGTVHDPSGVVVANAKIVLSSLQSEVTHEIRSDERGRFEFPRLPAGAYRLDVWGTEEAPRLANSANMQMSSTFAFGAMDLKKLGETVKLVAGESTERDVTLQFGPLQISAIVTWNETPVAPAAPQPSFPPDWRCLGVEAPFCGPASLVEEFEQDLRKAGRIPADVQPPRQVTGPQVLYPVSLQGSGTTGIVRLTGRIGADGFLTGLQVVGDPNPAFAQAALDGAGLARWEPARLRDVPVEVAIELAIDFQVR